MKTCYKCGERLFGEQTQTPTGVNEPFEMVYRCPNGHTGTVQGLVGEDQSEWRKTGDVWGPSVRADEPEDKE